MRRKSPQTTLLGILLVITSVAFALSCLFLVYLIGRLLIQLIF